MPNAIYGRLHYPSLHTSLEIHKPKRVHKPRVHKPKRFELAFATPGHKVLTSNDQFWRPYATVTRKSFLESEGQETPLSG
jgi:hypothetical protein